MHSEERLDYIGVGSLVEVQYDIMMSSKGRYIFVRERCQASIPTSYLNTFDIVPSLLDRRQSVTQESFASLIPFPSSSRRFVYFQVL